MSEVGQTPIHFAAMTGQNHFVQNIIERIGAKVLLFRGNDSLNFQGRLNLWTTFIWAKIFHQL